MGRLTEDDFARIEEFVNTPRYERSPDQLRPTGGNEASEDRQE